jgi:hypothetical protein
VARRRLFPLEGKPIFATIDLGAQYFALDGGISLGLRHCWLVRNWPRPFSPELMAFYRKGPFR